MGRGTEDSRDSKRPGVRFRNSCQTSKTRSKTASTTIDVRQEELSTDKFTQFISLSARFDDIAKSKEGRKQTNQLSLKIPQIYYFSVIQQHTMKIELSIHATKLANVAGAFKGTSDPFAVVTKIATNPGEKPEVVGKTEVIKNTLSPSFVKVFTLDYDLGSVVKVAVSLFDEVRKSENKSMGVGVFDIGEVLGTRGNTKGKRLKGGGTLYLHVRKAEGSGVLRLKLSGEKLKNVEGMGILRKSDPFYEIYRRIDAAGGQTWDNVHRSEFMKNNLNPTWKDAVVPLSILCGGDLDAVIKISVFDHEGSGDHTPMGDLETSVNGLTSASLQRTAMRLTRKGKDTGMIRVDKCDVSGVEEITDVMKTTSISSPPAPSVGSGRRGSNMFLDYIGGGCELNVCVAIDFTGSNGDPRKPGTLHYLNSGGRNDYENAMSAVVSILSKYDSDQQFPVWGFGAKYGGVVRHCFQCGGADKHTGVTGVLKAYRAVFSSGLIMSGPTVFDEVIRTAGAHAESAQAAAKSRGGQCYTVLLILTDGAVSDARAAAQALKDASQSPLSVVIIGVGDADFSGMQFLDDCGPPNNQRDIAQFVEFNNHRHSSQSLTSATLNEIPTQLTEYFQSMGIQPNPPIMRSDEDIVVESEEEIDLTLDIGEAEIVVTGGGDDFSSGFGEF
jgi:Copine/C2 domain